MTSGEYQTPDEEISEFIILKQTIAETKSKIEYHDRLGRTKALIAAETCLVGLEKELKKHECGSCYKNLQNEFSVSISDKSASMNYVVVKMELDRTYSLSELKLLMEHDLVSAINRYTDHQEIKLYCYHFNVVFPETRIEVLSHTITCDQTTAIGPDGGIAILKKVNWYER